MKKIKPSFLGILILSCVICWSLFAVSAQDQEGVDDSSDNSIQQPMPSGDESSAPPASASRPFIQFADYGKAYRETMKELLAYGFNEVIITKRDQYNFLDGSFDKTARIIELLRDDKILKNYPKQRDQIKQFINSSGQLFYPWTTEGSVKLYFDGDNAMAELQDNASMADFILFKNNKAVIEFDLKTISSGKGDIFEVVLETSSQEVMIASYDLGSSEPLMHESVELAKVQGVPFQPEQKGSGFDIMKLVGYTNPSAHPDLEPNPESWGAPPPLSILKFRLKKSQERNQPTLVRLDNFNITYKE